VALFNTNQIQLNRLANESVSVALATDGRKTLHVVTKFYWYEQVQYLEADPRFEITCSGTLETYGDLGQAVDRYNEL
jgi:hypothetical protein